MNPCNVTATLLLILAASGYNWADMAQLLGVEGGVEEAPLAGQPNDQLNANKSSAGIQVSTETTRREALRYPITGYSQKSVSLAVHLFFVRFYCCFIQTWYINNK